jgi:hypothetical protein
MSEEEDSGSYSGLMIGLMVAGGIVLILVLLAVFGMGVWFFDVAGPGPGPSKPPPVAMVEEKMPAAPEFKIENPRKRLIGAWIATTVNGGRKSIDFHDDGTYRLLDQGPGEEEAVATTGTWKLELDKERPNLKLIRIPDMGGRAELEIRFLDDDRFVHEGWDGSPYQRQPQTKQ